MPSQTKPRFIWLDKLRKRLQKLLNNLSNKLIVLSFYIGKLNKKYNEVEYENLEREE
tara:strand:- start:541 stop:711 length:171 start_codon:yes stop_codon:yes gene_type:complete